MTIPVIMGEINEHMRRSGVPNSGWYVGITSDTDDRLFGFHRVRKTNHWYIARQCKNSTEARSIEAAYHRAGCKGGTGGGDNNSMIVYAYVITDYTVE